MVAPLLVAMYFQAASELLTATVQHAQFFQTLIFRTAKDFVFTGSKVNQCKSAIDFMFEKSLHADDKTKLSDSIENSLKNLQPNFTVFKHFGPLCQVRACQAVSDAMVRI